MVKNGEKLRSLEGLQSLPRFGQLVSRWSAPDLKVSVKKKKGRKGPGARARTGSASVVLWYRVMRMGIKEDGRRMKMNEQYEKDSLILSKSSHAIILITQRKFW